MLTIQAITLFIVVPLSVRHPWGRSFLNLSHLAFTTICITVLVRHRLVQTALVVSMILLVAAPFLQDRLSILLSLTPSVFFEATACIAFGFNAIITALVGRHVFGPGRVTAHRIEGAVLLYLNVAALFSIAFFALSEALPHAIEKAGGEALPDEIATRVAALVYFSLTTITTSGYGDLIPLSPFARSLANLEGVFGHLFPATLLARVVALHIAHGSEDDGGEQAPS